MQVATPKHFCKYCGADATVIVKPLNEEAFHSCRHCYKVRKARPKIYRSVENHNE